MSTLQWQVDCALNPPLLDWFRRGGAAAACVDGRCPGTSGVRVSGGNYWGISIPTPPGRVYGTDGNPFHSPYGDLVTVKGYAGVYANIPTLNGNSATPYWIMVLVHPGDMNWAEPGPGLRVMGDGSLAVASDHLEWGRTAAGFIAAGTTYFFELAAIAGGTAVGTTEVHLDGVNVAALLLSGIDTRSNSVSDAGFKFIGLGSNQTTDFNDFYFNTTGFLGSIDCTAQFAGVTEYRHRMAGGTIRSTVTVGGQPKGGYRRYKPLFGSTHKPYPTLPIGPILDPVVEGELVPLALSEETTIAAAGFTDTTIQMPAGSVVFGVNVRVTTAIPGPTTAFSVGDAADVNRFQISNVPVALGSTDPGTKAGAYPNTTARAVRLSMIGGSPATNAGRVRVTISYLGSAS